jgi:hypothetical protein
VELACRCESRAMSSEISVFRAVAPAVSKHSSPFHCSCIRCALRIDSCLMSAHGVSQAFWQMSLPSFIQWVDVYGEALRTAGSSGTLLHWQVQNLYPCLTLIAFRSSPSGAEQVDYALPACKPLELERSRWSKERTQRPFSQLRYT